MFSDLAQPCVECLKRVLIVNRVSEQNAFSPLVVGLSDSFEALLTCSVPDLHPDLFSVNQDGFAFEVDSYPQQKSTDGSDVRQNEGVGCELKQNVGFANARVSNYQKLCQEVILGHGEMFCSIDLIIIFNAVSRLKFARKEIFFVISVSDNMKANDCAESSQPSTTPSRSNSLQDHLKAAEINSFLLEHPNRQQLVGLLDFLVSNYHQEQKNINLGNIYQIPIKEEGVDLICQYFCWSITMLNLTMHRIGNQGMQSIIRSLAESAKPKWSAGWSDLQSLIVTKNQIDSAGLQGWDKLRLSRLETLNFNNNSIDSQGLSLLLASQMPNLKKLSLSNNKIGREGCQLLMNSQWNSFESLDLNYNLISNEGVHFICCAQWPQLSKLNLSNNKIDAKATYYLKKANWPHLESLLLNRNEIGKKDGKVTLMGTSNLSQMKSKQIKRLSVFGNQISLNGIIRVICSPNFAEDCFLELARNYFKFEEIRDLLKTHKKFCNEFQN